jgi:hypothetical protein
MAFVFSSFDAIIADSARKAVISFSTGGSMISLRLSLLGSISNAIRAMHATASTGYFPYAVSPESITASVRE